MARRSLRQARILITGASSGIGHSLARVLATEGNQLLLTARREERLVELARTLEPANAKIRVMPGDITDPHHRARLADDIRSHWGAVDILVNNAGAGARGPFASSNAELLRRIMEVNFFAPVELTRILLPLLRQGRHPAICNVGSVLGHRAVPLKSEYCASKFALHGFSDALRCELRSQGVDVVLVSPSTTATEFFDHAVTTGEDAVPRPQEVPWHALSPEVVAAAIVAGLKHGAAELIVPWSGKGLVYLDRLFPSLMDSLVSRRLPS